MNAKGVGVGGVPVAIVGIGCRFPGGITDPVTFWRFLAEGRDAITEIPRSRIDIGHYFDARPATPGRIMTRWGGFLDNIENFDPFFFGISPREAERLDPQQRLVLETAWEALEDAGLDVSALNGSPTGVFVGQWLSDFESRLFADPDALYFYMTTGSGRYATSGRLSYLLGLRGPSLTVDTACSSSLVAVHMAVRSIRAGESTLALAGGVNTILQPHISVAYSQSRMMAPDGRCKFGDAAGDGYVRSEGAGLVVLKSLARAQADGDRIYAVIRGSAVNNDGHSSGSMGTPSRVGQGELLRTAYHDAGVSPGVVGYVEAHGTGTRAGDPVELGALSDVLSEGREPGRRARVGSVKTNFGHTEGAAGIAGLMKVALSLHHRMIPASLHCKQLNPVVPWAQIPVEVARTQQPWPSSSQPRLAGVSAFGIAGTNAHIVLEEAPPASERAVSKSAAAHVLALSARSAQALAQMAGAYAERLESPDPPTLGDLCASAAIHRTPMEYRAAFSTESVTDLIERLRRFVAGEKDAAQAVGQVAEPRARRIAFVFPGQGSQWAGMARELSEREPIFAQALGRCEDAMRPFVDWSLHEQLFAAESSAAWRMDDIAVIQPALLAVEIALGDLWRGLGVEPVAVVGHSMGEVGAAYFAGALSLDDAMAVICRRSALMRTTSGHGAMAVVELSLDELAARLLPFAGQVSVAVSNAPRSSVMSGDPAAVAQILAQLEREGIFARQVKVDVASHSPQMEPLVPALVGSLAGLRPMATHFDLYSTVLSRKIEGAEVGSAYWGRNLRQPVLFGATIEAMLLQGIDAFIELSPHPLLLTAIAHVSQSAQRPALTLQSTRRQEPEQRAMLASLGALFASGHPVEWSRLFPAGFRRVDLPKYPWQRERFWLAEIDAAGRGRVVGAAVTGERSHPLLGAALDLAADDVKVWECGLDTGRVVFAAGHSLRGAPVLSAAALVEILLAAGRACFGSDCLEVTGIAFERALYLEPSGRRTTIQVRAIVANGGAARDVEIYSRHGESWRRHAHGRVQILSDDVKAVAPDPEPRVCAVDAVGTESPALVDAVVTQAPALVDAVETEAPAFYQALESAGVHYGTQLRGLESLRVAGNQAAARLHAQDAAEATGCLCSPALLEGCFQVAVATAPEFVRQASLVMPRSLASVRYFGTPGKALRVRLKRSASLEPGTVDLVGTDDSGGVRLEMRGLYLQPAGVAVSSDPAKWLYEVSWEPSAGAGATAPPGRWLLLTGSGDASAAFAAAVSRRLQASGGVAHVLGPTSDVGAELRRLRGQPGGWQAVVHCAAWDAAANARLTVTELAAEPIPGGALLLEVLRSLDSSAWERAPRLWIATSGAQTVSATEGVATGDTGSAAGVTVGGAAAGIGAAGGGAPAVVALGPLLGLAGVIASEHPDRFGALVDVDPRATAELQAAQLVKEVLGARGEPSVAMRGGGRYVARLANIAAPPTQTLSWRADATCMLTGGLGGVGMHVARWLVARGARRLLLVGRTPIPPRADWSRLAAGTANTRVLQIKELESLGAEVHYAAADLSDRAQVSTLLERWHAEGRPPIRSVFHAAGTIDDRLLARVDASSIEKVFASKARAAWILHELSGDVDHFVLFSSVASVWANAGQGSYAAANAFLDSLAQYRRAIGRHALSVSWGVWAETGFGATEGGRHARERLEQDGLYAFEPADALIALGTALECGRAHVAVLKTDWARWSTSAGASRPAPALLRQLVSAASTKAKPTAAAATPEPVFLDELRAAPAERRTALLEERIARHVSGILKLPSGRLDPRKPLGSYGLDSMMAIELRDRLERDVGLALSATLIWNYPTVLALAALLAGKIAPASEGAASVPTAGAPTSNEPTANGQVNDGQPPVGHPAVAHTAGVQAEAANAAQAGSAAGEASVRAGARARSEVEALSDEDALAALRASRGRRK